MLKTHRNYSFVMAILMLLLYGCTGTNQQPKVTLPAIPNVDVKGISTEKDHLVFDSFESFKRTVIELENNLEAYDDAFMAQVENKSIDEIEAIEEKLGYNEFAPLLSFEKKFKGHESLFRKLADAEEKWLDSAEDLDWDKNPDNHAIDNPVMRALVNEDGVVEVEGKLYKTFPNGVSYAVTDGDEATLKLLTDEYASKEYRANNVFVNDNSYFAADGIPKNCAYNKQKETVVFLSSDRLVVHKIQVKNGFFTAKYMSRATHYKKKRRRWKKRRASMKCGITNDVSQLCDPNFGSIQAEYEPWSPSLKLTHKTFKRRRSRAIRDRVWGSYVNTPNFIPTVLTKDDRRIAENGNLETNNTVEEVNEQFPLAW